MARSTSEPQAPPGQGNSWKRYLTSPSVAVVVTALIMLLVIPLFLQALGADISLFAREPVPAVVINGNGQGSTSSDAEVAALRAQIELMRQYDQRLVETVYWGLGSIITVAIALVGFGAFANFRLYERDRLALHQELSTMVERARGSVEQVLSDQAAERYNEIEKAAREAVATATAELKSETDRSLSNLSRELRFTQRDLLQAQMAEADRAAIRSEGLLPSHLTFRLSLAFAMLRLGSEIGYPWYITHDLDKARALLTQGAITDALLMQTATKTLDELPSEYSQSVEAIKKLLVDAYSRSNPGQ